MKKLKLVITGAGEVGYHLIADLCKEDLELLVIDTNKEVLEKLKSEYDISVEESNIIDSRFMKRKYLEDVDLFLAITNSDETNMIACKTASDGGAKKTICRIRQIDFSTSKKGFSLQSMGIDWVINPVSLVAEEIFHLVQSPNLVDRHEFVAGNILLVGFKIRKFSNITNIAVTDLEDDLTARLFKIAVIQRGDMTIVPSEETVIEADDVVYFFCQSGRFQALRAFLGYTKKTVKQKRVFINGGGHIGVRLATRLEKANHKVKVIEKDITRSLRISEQLSKSLVLNFDGTDLKQLIAEGIENADCFISVTNDEKVNLTSCLLATEQEVGQTISLVQQPEFVSIIDQNTKIDFGLSPRVLTTRYLARFIQSANIQSYFHLRNSHIAILEFHLNEFTPCLSIPLKDLQFPDDVLVGIIKRGDEILIPSGEHTLESGDTILLIVHRIDKSKAMEFFQPLSFK